MIVTDSISKENQLLIDRVSQSQIMNSTSQRKISYLEEYDQSKQKSNRKDDYSGKYSEIVEEDINLRLGSSKKL